MAWMLKNAIITNNNSIIIIIIITIIIFDSTWALDASCSMKIITLPILDTPSKLSIAVGQYVSPAIAKVQFECNSVTLSIHPRFPLGTACGCREDGTVRGLQVILNLCRWHFDVEVSGQQLVFWHFCVLQSSKPQPEVWTRACPIVAYFLKQLQGAALQGAASSSYHDISMHNKAKKWNGIYKLSTKFRN